MIPQSDCSDDLSAFFSLVSAAGADHLAFFFCRVPVYEWIRRPKLHKSVKMSALHSRRKIHLSYSHRTQMLNDDECCTYTMAPEGLVVRMRRVVAYFPFWQNLKKNHKIKRRRNEPTEWRRTETTWKWIGSCSLKTLRPTLCAYYTHINYIIYDTCRNNGHARAYQKLKLKICILSFHAHAGILARRPQIPIVTDHVECISTFTYIATADKRRVSAQDPLNRGVETGRATETETEKTKLKPTTIKTV